MQAANGAGDEAIALCRQMTNFNPNGITSEASVQGLLQRIDQLNLDNTGTFWHANGEVLPWAGQA